MLSLNISPGYFQGQLGRRGEDGKDGFAGLPGRQGYPGKIVSEIHIFN